MFLVSKNENNIFIWIWKNSPINHFLPPFYFTHSLSLSIYPELLGLPTSYSLPHSILLNYPLSHCLFYLYIFPYSLYRTHTLSAFSRSATSPISVISRNKTDCGTDLLPLATINRIYRDDGIRSILISWTRSAWLGSVWLSSLSSDLSFVPLDLLIFFDPTYHLDPTRLLRAWTIT